MASNSPSSPYYICTTVNPTCGNSPGGLATSGSITADTIAYFAQGGGSPSIGSSILSMPSSSLITVGGNLSVGTATNAQLSLGTGASGATSGSLVFNQYNSTTSSNDSITIEANSSALPSTSIILNLPQQAGTLVDNVAPGGCVIGVKWIN